MPSEVTRKVQTVVRTLKVGDEMDLSFGTVKVRSVEGGKVRLEIVTPAGVPVVPVERYVDES